MRKILILLSLCAFAQLKNFDNTASDLFKYNIMLDHNNAVRLDWNVNLYSERPNTITFQLTVMLDPSKRSVPIIGFGMSERGEFKNADLVVFEQSKGGQSFVAFDCHTNEKGELIHDTKRNYAMLYSRNNGKYIELMFERRIDTCDPSDYLIEAGTVHLIHFLVDPRGQFASVHDISSENCGFDIVKHATSFDMKEVQLIRSTFYDKSAMPNVEPSQSRYFDITNNKVRLPAQLTTYWCKVHKLHDRFKEKYHIIGYEGLISNSSKGKHLNLQKCFMFQGFCIFFLKNTKRVRNSCFIFRFYRLLKRILFLNLNGIYT